MGKEMKSRLIWISGISLIGAFMIGMLVAMPRFSNADSSLSPVSSSDIISTYQNSLISPLNRATSEVKDPEIAGFSQKLIKSYELEKVGAGDASNTEISDLVPDIAKIQKTALNTTLKEAGKQLKDKELSDFYHRFITKCGADK